MDLNGVVLVSAVVDFQTLRFDIGNDLPYVIFLPAYATTAWYHEQLGADLQAMSLEELTAEVERFAERDYLFALQQGDQLPPAQRAAVIDKLSRYTGLSKQYLDRAEMRVPIFQFTKELLRDQRRVVGRFDSRYTGIDRDANGETMEHDPSADALFGAFTAALYHYLRTELKVERDMPYEILTPKVDPWSFGRFENRFVTASETLRSAMTQNPAMRVLVVNGYYDLATPNLGIKYTFNHLRLDENIRDHVEMAFFEAGHMMYVHEPSLVKLKSDLRAFYAKADGLTD
jgi:carboxypeptidase C (cathepsin A)